MFSITLPSQQTVAKFVGLISATAWCDEDKSELCGILKTFEALGQEVTDAQIKMERLKNTTFGSNSEHTDQVEELFKDKKENTDQKKQHDAKEKTTPLATDKPDADLLNSKNQQPEQNSENNSESVQKPEEPQTSQDPKKNPQSKGHGRRRLSHISSAELVFHHGTKHQKGSPCPCCNNKLSDGHKRKTTVISAQALLKISIHTNDTVECKSCGFAESAPLPEKLAQECIGRYHMSAIAVLAYFRYFCGFASHRLDVASAHLSVRAPESTQWDLFESAANLLMPMFKHLKKKIANSSLIWMDHTHNHILSEEKERRQQRNESDTKIRIGMSTSCFLSRLNDGKCIALYHTGPIDAGQYLREVLKFRKDKSGPLVVACDALASNLKQNHSDLKLALCNAHARRQFVELGKNLPKNGRQILALYKIVFKNDKIANNLDSKSRLEYHITHSLPLMLRMRDLALTELLSDTRLPTGEITNAFAYFIRHFENLCAFCKIENAPLHTNDVERALKKSILHRKNSLFFQTPTGAAVGDLMTSLCMSAHLNSISPVWYLTKLLCNAHSVKLDPEKWMPWNIACTV
jgi:transposase